MVRRHIQNKKNNVHHYWREMMGWTYMVICIFDFILFPLLHTYVEVMVNQPITDWKAITLQNGGFFHVAMGAVLGVSAYGKMKEQLVMNMSSTPEISENNTSINRNSPVPMSEQSPL